MSPGRNGRVRGTSAPFAVACAAVLAACSATAGPRADVGPGGDAPPGEVALDAAAAAPEAAASLDDAGSSRGTGGLACARSSRSPGGRDVCFATVAGLELGVLPPRDPASRLVLGLYLHGDGARAHLGGSVFDGLAELAARRGVLFVSALAPNGCSWWQAPDHDCAGVVNHRDRDDANASALAAALDALRSAYDLANDVLYYTSSGGSIFLTTSFLPLHGGRFPGVAAVNCGGEAPARARFAWPVGEATARGPLALRFTYGDADPLAEDAHAAAQAYGGLGVPVRETVLPGVGHCAFDQHAAAAALWDDALAARGSAP